MKPRKEVVSVFADYPNPFAEYSVELTMEEYLSGGIPAQPEIIEAWLKKNLVTDEVQAFKDLVEKTMRERNPDLESSTEITDEHVDDALKDIVSINHTVGFKRDGNGLYIEERCVKAMLRENVSIIWSGDRNTPTRKAFRGYFNERVFVTPSRIYLGTDTPDRIHTYIGHPTGPQGKVSTLSYYEQVWSPTLAFNIQVFEDCIPENRWPVLWKEAELNGLGALRSSGFGRFAVTKWERIRNAKRHA